jgi:hypothetical protein
MFVRKKNNPSGVVSVQIIDKSGGKYKVYRTVGSSSDATVVEDLYFQGKKWIAEQKGLRDMFLEHARHREEKEVVSDFLNKVENILLNGTRLILNPVYENIGFNAVNDDILRHLVVSRICHPRSKVATVDYLKSYFDEDVELHKIYRYLDKLSDTQKDKIQ